MILARWFGEFGSGQESLAGRRGGGGDGKASGSSSKGDGEGVGGLVGGVSAARWKEVGKLGGQAA